MANPRITSPLGTDALALASTTAIENALASRISTGTPTEWIDPRNRYLNDTIERVKADLSNGILSAEHNKDFVQWVASSAPVHCVDGWGFLSRALNAALRGDSDAARHLAYYSELRSCSSLLARCGIAVLNNQHFVIDDSGTARHLTNTEMTDRPGTHVAAWLLLDGWSSTPAAAQIIAESVRPEARSIADWISSQPRLTNWSLLSSKWMKSFGADVAHYGQDRAARNVASYRPTRIATRQIAPAHDVADFIVDLWNNIDGNPEPFAVLDRHMLRLSTEQAYEGTTDQKPMHDAADFEHVVDSQIAAIGLSTPSETKMRGFLLRQSSPSDSKLIELARRPVDVSSASHHLESIARAAVLCRIATGASQRLISAAGGSIDTLGFWWRPLLNERGIGAASQFSDVPDMVENIREANVDLDDWSQNTHSVSYVDLKEVCGHQFSTVDSAELAGLLGLAS